MTTLVQVVLLATLLAEPLLALAVDLRAHLYARRARGRRGDGAAPDRVVPVTGAASPVTDLTVVVPVVVLDDLEGLAWLHTLGDRVLLVAPAHEAELHRRLWAVAVEHGFRVHVEGAGRRRSTPQAHGRTRSAERARVELLRDAHSVLTSGYVICLDPGSVVGRPLDQVAGALAAARLDVGTMTTAVAARDGRGRSHLPERVLQVEDVLASRLRRLAPWWVRGGTHVARRTVHADLVRRHTGFGPGAGLEVGVLAGARGHRVGHLDVPVRAGAARTPGGWWWCRVVEAAGLFRVAALPVHLAVRRPALQLGWVALAFGVVPLLWWSVVHVPWVLVPVLLTHGACTAVLTRSLRDAAVWLYPLHALVRTLVVLPAGALLHVTTALRSGEGGALQVHEPWWGPADEPVVRRLRGPGPARATDWWAPR